MREFFKIMGQYFAPYKKYVAGTLSFNVLSAFFNVFSFTLLLPILNILFQIDKGTYHLMSFSDGSLKDVTDIVIDFNEGDENMTFITTKKKPRKRKTVSMERSGRMP